VTFVGVTSLVLGVAAVLYDATSTLVSLVWCGWRGSAA
jgi:hypothetical protein